MIRNISDTALWVAIYRADESERTDAVFKDKFARILAGERGSQIVDAMETGRKNSWSFVARTFLFDEFIIQHVKDDFDMIINLGCGLDTRPYRLQLPSKLTWIDIDLPEIINYMQLMLSKENANCQIERIALDLSDRQARLDLFHQLGKRGKKILVIAEGLISYLDEVEAGALSYDLSHQKNFRHWLIDLMSPGILPLIQLEMGKLLEDANAPLRFAPEEGEEFFLLFGWKPIESKSKLKTAATLKRLPLEMIKYAHLPEPKGKKGNFPWSGVCLFENNIK